MVRTGICMPIVYLLVALACLTGCSEKEVFSPHLTGNLVDEGQFQADTLQSVESAWFGSGQSAGKMWESKRLVVCNWKGYLSRCFVRFSSLPDSLAEITNATLSLYGARVEGAVGANSFAVYALSDSLDQDDTYWNSMPGLGEQLAVFSFPAEQETSVTVDLTEIVSSWVSKERPNLGLAIALQEEESSPEIIVELVSREGIPREIISAGDTTTLETRPFLLIAYVDTAKEEQYEEYKATEDTFADTLLAPLPNSGLVCGNGFPSRSFIRFDVSEVPREATVIEAALRLTTDLEESSFDSMGVICHAALDSIWPGFDTRFGVSGAGQTELVRRDFGNPTIRMDITPIVQLVVSRKAKNCGLMIKSVNETFDLDFVRFFPSGGPDPDKVPNLVIHYMMPGPPWYWRQ